MLRVKRLRVLVAVLAGCAGLAVLLHSPAVHADPVYPYGDKPCTWAPYATVGTTAKWCADYDWGDNPGDLSAANVISPYGYFYRNCTDYTAWRVSTLGVGPELYKGLGHAKQWGVLAATKGIVVDDVPAVGAVAVRTTGQYGHTAFVEAVDEAGKITVSQYNYKADGNYSQQRGTPAGLGFTVFVHFEAFETDTAVEAAPVETPQPVQPTIDPSEEPADPNQLLPDELPEAVTSKPPETTIDSPPAQQATPEAAAIAPETWWQPNDNSPPLAAAAPQTSDTTQAETGDPPAQQPTPVTQPVAAHTSANVSLDYWSLIGLTGAALAREAVYRRWR